MAIIDNDGVQQLKEKAGNALTSIYEKLDKNGQFTQVSEEFDFLFRLLEEIETWERPNIQSSQPKSVVIDGKLYTPQIGS